MYCTIKDTDKNLAMLAKIVHMKKICLQSFYKAAKSSTYFRAYHKLKKMGIFIDTNPKIKNLMAYIEPLFTKNKITSFNFSYGEQLASHTDDFLYEVVSHEMAHAFEFLIRGDSDHRKEWKKIHRMIGGSGNAACDYLEVARDVKKNGTIIGNWISQTKIEKEMI